MLNVDSWRNGEMASKKPNQNFLEYYSNFLDKKLYNNNAANYECSKLKIKKIGADTPNVHKHKSNK